MPPRPITRVTKYFPARTSPGLTLGSSAGLVIRGSATIARPRPSQAAAHAPALLPALLEELVLDLHDLVVEADDQQPWRPMADELRELLSPREHARGRGDHRAHRQPHVRERRHPRGLVLDPLGDFAFL